MTLTGPAQPETTPRAWWFLGLRIDELTDRRTDLVVSEAILPEGASPPLHVHGGLDDSFYLLEGLMVVRCGEDVSPATPGTWVPFPRGLPHTFRVLDGPARVLLVHNDDSFMGAVRHIGSRALEGDGPPAGEGPSLEQLTRSLLRHDITTVGPAMEEDEARRWLELLS